MCFAIAGVLEDAFLSGHRSRGTRKLNILRSCNMSGRALSRSVQSARQYRVHVCSFRHCCQLGGWNFRTARCLSFNDKVMSILLPPRLGLPRVIFRGRITSLFAIFIFLVRISFGYFSTFTWRLFRFFFLVSCFFRAFFWHLWRVLIDAKMTSAGASLRRAVVLPHENSAPNSGWPSPLRSQRLR